MELSVYIATLIVSSLLSASSGTNTCEVRDRQDCVYTIICVTYAGNAWTPECEYGPHVTFVITKSITDTLTAGFFGSTNFDSRVRVITAISNSWTTIESLAFRYYTKTLIMDLSNNKIEIMKNEAFKNLLMLQWLNISNNAIQSLNPKTFLISESRNSDLETLDLSNNLLTDLTGDPFTYIPNLRKLYLQNNKLVIVTDDSFSNVKNLLLLDMSNNQLSALNMTLISLKLLQTLDVSQNKLHEISGYEINRLLALETVNMSHNSIEIIESNCFNQAFNLTVVDLSHNIIKSTIENVFFINNNNLKYLNLYDNNITLIQDNAFQHNRLQYLNLEKNNLTGEISGKIFSGLKNTTTLNLSNQSITLVGNHAFSDATNLLYLNLSHNNIQFIENSSFSGALSLNILDVSHNKLSYVNFLKYFSENLTEIYLQNNNLVVLPESSFKYHFFLQKLDISQNMIEKIEPNSLPLESLQYLYLSRNRLGGVLHSQVFSPARFLRFLDLSNFKFKRIEKMAFVDLPVLARLNISYNELEYIDPNNFLRMDNIYSLDLSYNKLPNLYLNNSSLIKLKALYLKNNIFSNISQTLINMTGLVYVDLSNNNISDLSDVPFTSLPNLKVLLLSYNKIKVFNNPQTNSLVQLTDLSLAGNQLTDINLSYFRNLVVVDISHNNFTFFNSSIFDDLDYLQSIDLSFNDITQLSPGIFRTVKILKFLNLAHNKIANIRYGTFRGLNRTEVLDLSYNNLVDFEVDVFHECGELRRLTLDYNHLESLDVERLVLTLPKLTTLSLGGNPLSCKEIVRNIKSINKNVMIRQVEVTSIDKIYHEDNVHGIKCGETFVNETTVTPIELKPDSSSSLGIGIVIWCSVLTVIIFIIGLALLLYYNHQKEASYSGDSRLQLRQSVTEFPETNEDLLG